MNYKFTALLFLCGICTVFAQNIEGAWGSKHNGYYLKFLQSGRFEANLKHRFSPSLSVEGKGEYFIIRDGEKILFDKGEGSGVAYSFEILEDGRLVLLVGSQALIFSKKDYAQAESFHMEIQKQAKGKAIQNNLRQIASAGQQYMLEKDAEEVGYNQLAEEYFSRFLAVNGEDYSELIVKKTGGELVVLDRDGQKHTFKY